MRNSRTSTVAERFWSFVDKRPDGCWIWIGGKQQGGYGHFNLPFKAGQIAAHRWAWEDANGAIPEGAHLDHLCHTWDRSCPGGDGCPHRPCVRPDHLEPVSVIENVRRGRGAPIARATHCPECGDELTTFYRTGRWGCLACFRKRAREAWRAKNPEVEKPPRTHCPNGHPYEGNTCYMGGKRRCKACTDAALRRYREKQRAARRTG